MTKEELQQLRDGEFILNFSNIELSRVDGSETYNGPGYIRQTKTSFEIMVFVGVTLEFKDAFAPYFSAIVPGKLIPREKYWLMKARDSHGREWTSSKISHVGAGGSTGEQGHLRHGSCLEIRMSKGTEEPTDRVAVRLTAFTRINYPCNANSTSVLIVNDQERANHGQRNVAIASSRGFEFDLVQDETDLVLRAISDQGNAHPFLVSRIGEALLFATGAKVEWAVEESYANGITSFLLRSKTETSQSRGDAAPLLISNHELAVEVWKLFELYFSYAFEERDNEYHPLSARVLSAEKSSGTSIETHALNISIAVESAVTRFFETPSVNAEVSQNIQSLTNHIDLWSGNADIKRRALGTIKQIATMRAFDKLKLLAATNVVDQQNIDAWKKMRNSMTHADWSGIEDLQNFLLQSGCISVLLHQLIFCLIGYTGKYTNWGKLGWPLANYPPNTPV